MADPLNLSYWLKNHSVMSMPLYFRRALETFPVSKLSPGGVLRVYAISFNEAPQAEEYFETEFTSEQVMSLAQEFLHEDCAFQFTTKWDLWQWDGDWALKPAKISIESYGPLFEIDYGDSLRIVAESESMFLPNPNSDQWRPVQSNIRSLLRLATDLDGLLPVEKRLLWSENDENFSEKLEKLME